MGKGDIIDGVSFNEFHCTNWYVQSPIPFNVGQCIVFGINVNVAPFSLHRSFPGGLATDEAEPPKLTTTRSAESGRENEKSVARKLPCDASSFSSQRTIGRRKSF